MVWNSKFIVKKERSMHVKDVCEPVPLTMAICRALNSSKEAAKADLLFLESCEIHKPMHLGLMLRVRQIRLANPGLAADIAAELAAQGKGDGLRSSKMQSAPAFVRQIRL